MNKIKVRTLITACVMIILCTVLIVGGTYALWTDTASVNNHLIAGTLDVKLERVSLTKTYLDSTTGYLVTTLPDTNVVDFSDNNSKNVFGFSDYGTNKVEKLVPNSSYEATLRLTNNGDVAFTYDIIIKLTSETNELAQQLKVFVSNDNGELIDKGYLSDYSNNGLAIIETKTMAKNDVAKEFTIKIVFDDLNINNNAMNQNASFDLLVNAVQKTNA